MKLDKGSKSFSIAVYAFLVIAASILFYLFLVNVRAVAAFAGYFIGLMNLSLIHI